MENEKEKDIQEAIELDSEDVSITEAKFFASHDLNEAIKQCRKFTEYSNKYTGDITIRTKDILDIIDWLRKSQNYIIQLSKTSQRLRYDKNILNRKYEKERFAREALQCYKDGVQDGIRLSCENDLIFDGSAVTRMYEEGKRGT